MFQTVPGIVHGYLGGIVREGGWSVLKISTLQYKSLSVDFSDMQFLNQYFIFLFEKKIYQ